MSKEPENLPELDAGDDSKDQKVVIERVTKLYDETVAESLKICNNKDHNRGLYKNGVMQEIVMPADASAALIEGSGSFMLHLAFWLSIQFFVEPTRGEFYCFV